MLYYLGKGTEFKKEDCKQYKTIEGALKAAAKDEELTVWDETGQIIGSLTDNVPDGALNTNPDGSVPTYNEDGTPAGTISAATQETGENGENTTSDEQKDGAVIPQGTMKVTVICDGTLNLRRSPHWGNVNVCGRAARGQSYYVKEIHTVDGKKMVRTIDDIYLSGSSEHVQFEQL